MTSTPMPPSMPTRAPAGWQALRACRLFETTDLDEARARISRIMQPHRLTHLASGQTALAHMDFLPIGGIGIGTIAFGCAEIDVPPLAGYHLAIFCLSGNARLRIDREEVEIGRNDGIVCPANRRLRGRFSADCEQFVVRIDQARLAALDGAQLRSPELRLRLDSARPQPWLAALHHVANDATTIQAILRQEAVAKAYEQLLLRLFLSGCGPASAPAVRGARPRSVHRAIGFMQAHYPRTQTLAEIAQAAGVSARTLQDAFQRFEGVSPLRYLRNLRLDHAYAALRRGAPSGGVTGTAHAVGLTHMGRFARDYMARFGVAPSQTPHL